MKFAITIDKAMEILKENGYKYTEKRKDLISLFAEEKDIFLQKMYKKG